MVVQAKIALAILAGLAVAVPVSESISSRVSAKDRAAKIETLHRKLDRLSAQILDLDAQINDVMAAAIKDAATQK